MAITSNTVIGIGATPLIAQNGIQIGFGSTGKITSNTVADDIYTGANSAGAGILIYASAGITVSGNSVESTQFGIATVTDPTFGPADNATITTNHIGGTQNFDAIGLRSNGNIAESNTIFGSQAQSGIHIDDECPGPGSVPGGINNTVKPFRPHHSLLYFCLKVAYQGICFVHEQIFKARTEVCVKRILSLWDGMRWRRRISKMAHGGS
jgi:hypothetical protein